MDPFWISLADVVQKSATAIAVLVGGIWAYYRFGIKRESETALAIDLTHSSVSYQRDWLVFLDVCIENKGAVRLGAKRRRKPAYEDESEQIAYAADLLLRPVPPGSAPGSQVRWFADDTDTSPHPGDIEVDLVAEYVIGGETDFWMEPRETYHLGAAVVLPGGSYLVMMTFVGDRSDEDFWRRMFLVQVPEVHTHSRAS